MKANQITEVLNQFQNSSYKSVLINGDWGIGKTKYVMKFEKEHSNSCYISLFGRKDINSVLQDLYYYIIEDVPRGKLKKYYRYLSEKLNNLRLSYQGLSISIPLLADLHRSINKELEKKGDYIVILDDLERKHENLGMEEILGLIDSLSKIKGIKTVIIAAKDQFNSEDTKKFINYKEKAIDRIYTVTDYALEAPREILGSEVWEVIKKNVEYFKEDFKNLRTFEKINAFIKEVVDVIGEEIFTEEFTKADLYRMCFAIAFFNIEHKNKMVLLNDSDERAKHRNDVYRKGDTGIISYLCTYILKDSLDNTMSKNVFIHIKDWFEKGIYSKDCIFNVISGINNSKPAHFYLSQQEILNVIEDSQKFVKNLSDNEHLGIITIIQTVLDGLEWAEILDINYGISDEEIVYLIKEDIPNRIDIHTSLAANLLNFSAFYNDNKAAESLFETVNKFIKVEYYNLLINGVMEIYCSKSYGKFYHLRQTIESIPSIHDKHIRDNILTCIRNNNYFFPLPSGTIDEDLWNWCHLINLLIKDIEKHWGIDSLYTEFKTYNYKRDNIEENKILKYRLNLLFERPENISRYRFNSLLNETDK